MVGMPGERHVTRMLIHEYLSVLVSSDGQYFNIKVKDGKPDGMIHEPFLFVLPAVPIGSLRQPHSYFSHFIKWIRSEGV